MYFTAMPSKKRPHYGVKKVSKRFKGEPPHHHSERLQEEGPAQVSLDPQDQAGRVSVPGPSTVVPESGIVGEASR